MSSFRDLVKQVNEKKKTDPNYYQTKSDEKDEKKVSNFKDLVNQVNSGTITVGSGLNGSQVNSWYSGVKEISKEGYDFLSKDGYKAPSADLAKKIDTYLSQASDVGQYIRSNRNAFDNYDEVINNYNDTVNFLRSLRGGVESSNKYYSQWDTEEDYNFWDEHRTVENRQAWYSEQQANIDDLNDFLDNYYTIELWYQSYKERPWEHTDQAEVSNKLAQYNKHLAYKQKYGSAEGAKSKIAELESEMRNYERGNFNEKGQFYGSKVVDDYRDVMQNDDFAVGSQKRDYVNPTRDELRKADVMNDSSTWVWDEQNRVYRDHFGNPLSVDENRTYYNPAADRIKVTDKLSLYLSASDDERVQGALGDEDGVWSSVMKEGYFGSWQYLDDSEIEIYYYLLNQSQESADKYLADMQVELNRRQTRSEIAQWHTEYDEASILEKIVMNAATVPEKFYSNVDSFLETTLTGEYNPYSASHRGMHHSQTVRGDTAEELDANSSFKIPFINFTLGDIYQTGMSRIDSALATKVFGPGGVAFLGLGAAEEEAYRLYQQGASEEQITLDAFAAGASEAVWEYIAFGKLKELGKASNPVDWVKNVLIQGWNEAFEEGGTELTNIITNALIMGSQSDLAELYEENEEKAFATFVDLVKQELHAMFGGFIGGVGAGIGQATSSYIDTTSRYREAGKTIMETDGGAKALKELSDKVAGVSDPKMKQTIKRQAGKVSTEVATGKNIVGKAAAAVKNYSNSIKIGRLYDTVQTANNLNNASANQADIAKSLQRNGFNSDTANDIAEALVASYNGQALTKAQEKLLKSVQESKYVKKAVADIMANDLSTMGQRSKDIRNFEHGIYSDLATKAITEAIRKSTTENQFTPEGVYEVSDTGKAVNKDTGEEIEISGVAEISRGKLMLKLSDGTTINADSVSFASEGESFVYEAIADLGDNIDAETANRMLSKYDGSNAAVFARGMAQAYTYGFYGLDRSEMTGKESLSAELTKEQRNFAYGLGEKYRSVKDLADKAKARARKAPGKQGVYYRGKDGTATDIRSYLKQDRRVLNEMQTTGIEFMEKMSKMMGVRFNIFESWEENGTKYYLNENGEKTEGNPNGFYDPNTGEIYIDLFAGNDFQGTMLFTVAHELTHFMRQWSPEHFTKISKLVFSHAGFKGSVSSLVADKMNKSKRPLTYDAALEEVVADGMETILKDGKVAEFMADVKKTDSKVWAKLKEWFKNFADFLKKMVAAYSDESAQTVEGRKVADFSQKLLNQIEQIWAEGAVAAGENYQSSLTPGEDGTIVNENGDPVAHATEDGTVQLSMRTYDEEGRAAFQKYLEKCVKSKRLTQGEMQEMMDGIEDIYKTCKEFKDKYAPFSSWSDAAVVRDTYGKPVFSVVTPNGDYKMNLDFSLVCKKRRTLDAVFNEMSRRGIIDDFELGQKSVVKINEIIRKYGLETACALCFVDAKRFRQASMADSFTRLYNELVESLVPEDQRGSIEHFNFSGYDTIAKVENGIHTWDASKLDFTHLDEVMKNYGDGTVEYKAAKYIKSNAEGRKLLLRGDFMSSQGFDAVKTQNPDVLKLYNSKKGTGGPKAAFGDVQYMNEVIKKARFWTAKKAYAVGGIRIQSFSDYVPRMVFDYVQMIYDLAATKLPAHAYTKEALFVKQFGLTGVKINMSLIPAIAEGGIAPGLDANGNYVWAGESFDFETAKEIQNAEGYSENCGTICVGVSYQHILKLLSDPDIRMVIPYHKSGLNPIVAHMNKIAEFTDYTTLKTNPGGCQNTMDKNGNKVEVDFNFNEALRKTGDPKATVRQYLNWCAENEYTPRFAEFAWHENYYKLIEDFTLYDKDGKYVPQRGVKAVFPNESSAFGSMKSLIQEGLQEDAIVEGKRDSNLSAIVDEIQETLPKTEAEISEEQVAQADRDLEADTKFSERDSNYLDAVKRGDMETAQKMVAEAAKEAGYTEEVFHGMGNRHNVYKSGDGQYGPGVYFTRGKDIASSYGKVVDHLYVKVGKIADYDDSYKALGKQDDQTPDEFAQFLGFPSFDEMVEDWDNDPTEVASNPELIDLLKSRGFEGFIDDGNWGFVLWDFDGIEYRIKSADPVTYDDNGDVIPLSKRFDSMDSDIRFSDRADESNENSPAYTGEYANGVKFQHREDNPEKLKFLNDQIERGEYTTVYKALLKIGDSYYPPMASLEKDEKGRYTKLRGGQKLFDWIASDGKLTDEMKAKMKMKSPKAWQNKYADALSDGRNPWGMYGDFALKKADASGKSQGSVPAAYNPYQHSSDQVLNDQFEAAYDRPDLVVVECRIPNSELTDPYWAPYAKDPTGMHEWKTGPIAGQLKKTTRHVYMTRWIQPVRELSHSEVAQKISDIVAKESNPPRIYWNTINPNVLQELIKLGVEIDPYGSPMHINSENAKDMYGNPITDEIRAAREAEKAAKKAAKPKKTKKAKKAVSDQAVRYSERTKAPTFYSQMAKVVDGVKQEKLGAASVISMLRGKGVKAEEIKWSGIQAFLDGKKSVTKSELLEFIQGSMLQIEEEELTETVKYTDEERATLDELEAEMESNFDKIAEKWPNLFGEEMPLDLMMSDNLSTTISLKLSKNGLTNTKDGRRVMTLAKRIEGASAMIDSIARDARQNSKTAKWKDYKLDGGDNYRELVFKIPGSSYTNRAMTTHWGSDARGVLAHARMQDFDVGGKKMLFVEEIQSDWHNAGSSAGYTEGLDYSEVEDLRDRVELARSATGEAYTKWKKIEGEFGNLVVDFVRMGADNENWQRDVAAMNDRVMEARSEHERKRHEYVELANKLHELAGKVPDAPFRNNYQEFVLKRLIRMAAEEGYDSIGWTTADIQSDRWSREYAEGYRIEYDQDIPKFLKKYGKQWGATVGQTPLPGLNSTETYYDVNREETFESFAEWQDTVRREIDQQGGDQRNVLFGMDGNDWIAYDKQTGAEYDRATVNKASDSVWSMDITPAMKESVLTEGQPMYSYRGEKALNIDKEVLAKAKSLDKQGVPMDKIRRATGWWKQSDGKWRNEFATNEFLEPKAFNRNGLPSAIEARIAAFAEDEYMLVEPGYYSKEEADAVIEEYASRLRSKGLEFGYLSEFLDAPELYEAYPHMRDITLTFDAPSHLYGHYDPSGRGRIRLKNDFAGWGKAGREVLLHEIQHAIQEYEGFSKGTSVAAAGSYTAYSNNKGEIEARDVEARWRYSDEDRQHYEPVYFQDRTEDSVSNRSLLANAFESIAKPNEIPKIQEYKEKVALINAEEQKLRELNEQIKELSFAKGKRDTKKISDLRFDATQAANRINTYDKQLLRLEASKPLQDVLEREKKRAYKKAEQRGKEALAEYKSQVLAKQKETAEKWRESRKAAVSKARETADKRDARAKLQKLVLDTVKWISYPAKTDVKCPDILKKPYESFLQCIDLSSKRLANGGEATKNDLRLANAMGSLATALDKIMISQDPTQDVDKVLDTGYLDLPVDFVQKLRDMTENIKSMMVEGEYVVNTMTAAEVRQLSQMIRTLNHSIKTMSKLYANLRFANVEALGVDTMEFMDALGEIEKTGGMGDFVKWDNALPYYAFKRFGKGGESVFEGLMDAQDKLAFLAKEIFEFRDKAWTSKEASEWSEDTHTIELPKGGSLTLTTADAMSIYCLSRRDQGLQHLLGGGTRVLGLQKGSKKAKDSRSLLTIEDISAINSSLTDRQRAVAEAIQEFMSTVCSEWGNEISMKRFLTREFTEKFYFPIESNDENLPVKDPAAQQSDLFRLLNISATKPLTPGANNEVIIRNIFDVFTGHASDMARLNAFGMGLLDYMKWLNYREKTANIEGQIKVRGVRKSMQGAYGDSAMRYVLNLVKDVNGRASDGGDPNILMKWMRAGKTASVGSSLRVATLQITSYPRAALVLSPKSLALGLTKMPNIEKAKKYCGIALWKSFGFYDTNISRSIEDQMKGVTDVKQKLIELSLKGAELGDAITWGALWNACEYEVAQTTKNKVGSEEFYQEVGKKLREVVYRTQVVDSNLTRSQIMRSKRGMAQEAAAFMSEPTLSANILMDAGFEFGLEKRRTGSAKAAWAKTGSYIARAVAVYSIGQLAAALMEGLWDAWRDDDDEEFGQKFLDEFIENLALDLVPFNKIPIVSDVFEGALAMFDVGFYSADKMSSAWITQALSAADAWKDVFGGKSSTTAYNAIYKTTRALSSYFGVSVSGAMREVVALWNNTAGAYDSTLKIRQYDLSEADLGVELYEALISGNTRQADSLKAQFDDVESTQAALRKAIMDNYSSGGINRDTALRHLVEFSGMEEDDAYWKVEEWEYEKEFDDEFRKYNEFYEAVRTGKNLKAVTKEYTDHGVDAKTLASQITSYFKPLYKEMSKAERAALKGYLLNAYALLGYDRDKKSKDIDKWLED